MSKPRVVKTTMRQEHLSFIDEVESHFEEDYMTTRLSIMKDEMQNVKGSPFHLP